MTVKFPTKLQLSLAGDCRTEAAEIDQPWEALAPPEGTQVQHLPVL